MKCGVVSTMVVAVLAVTAFADNITIYDGASGNGKSPYNRYNDRGWWSSQDEDQEVEQNCLIGQVWDLEAFIYENDELSLVGGYDFLNGYDGTESGDIFIDLESDNDWDLVYDLSMSSGKYELYDVSNVTTFGTIPMSPENTLNAASNPVRRLDGTGTLLTRKPVPFEYRSGLSSKQAWGFEGTSHNVLTVDASALAGRSFTSHFTMSCGNDNLMGQHTAIPEPSLIGLLGMGMIALAAFRRRRN